MGRFVNVGKGSKRRPENREQVLENLEKLYGDGGVKAGRFRQDPETGKFISAYDWHMKYTKPRVRTHFIIGDIEPYESPIDDRVITSRRQMQYDLEKNGCRHYEGLEQEQIEADRINAEKDKKFDEGLDKALQQTANELRYKAIKPETRIKSAWITGDE